jgi:flagellar motor protein MotB
MAHEEDQHGGHGDGHGDGGHKKHKKHHPHKHEEHEHEEGWIVSFADNVLLMMGFFVIMLAQNMGPKGTSAAVKEADDRVADVAIAIRAGFNNPLDMASTDPRDQPLIRRMKERETIGTTTKPGPDGSHNQSQTVRQTDIRGADGFVEFDQRSTVINDAGRRTIRQLAGEFAGKRWVIEVRGHSSRVESRHDPKISRDLSYARAYAVAEALVNAGLKWEQLRVVSVGDANPVTPRPGGGSGTTSNQRVEILNLKEEMPADAYNNAP